MEADVDELSAHLNALSTSSYEIPKLDHQTPLSTYILPSMSSCPMATDKYHHLLVYHHQSLILFQLPPFEVVFSISITPFIQCAISDICFYAESNCFLLSSANTIYSLSSTNTIDVVHKFANSIWSMTHSAKLIFICYLFGSSIEQWDLNATDATLSNAWLKEDLLEPLDMGINCIRAVDQVIGMTIKEKNFSWRIDLFDALTMHRMRRGRTIQQENGLSNWIGILFPIDRYRWLFADGDEGLFVIDQTDEHDSKQDNLMRLACNICLIRDMNSKKHTSIVVQSYEALHIYDIK